MKCLLALASFMTLATAQYQYPIALNNVDPSATNDYDLNRLIAQVLTQAAAIQPEFTSVEQQPATNANSNQNSNPSSQQYSSPVQNQYGAPQKTNPEEYGVPESTRAITLDEYEVPEQQQQPQQQQRNNNNNNNQYRAPERQRQQQEVKETQYAAPSRPNFIRNEYSAPARQQESPRAATRQSQSDWTPIRKPQAKKNYGTPKINVRNEYNAPPRENIRNNYRQNQNVDEFGLPEQQELKELDEIDVPSSEKSNFSGRSQKRGGGGGYSSTRNSQSSSSARAKPVSNDLATASSSSGYYDNSYRNSPSSGYAENLNSLLQDEGGEIKKFIYIHTAPDELQPQPRPRIPKVKPPPPETHYNIIFVKAPVPPREVPAEIELPSPPLQKTLVYVLLKKPEAPPEIIIPSPPPTQPSKPEVYFIRYSDKIVPNANNNQDEDAGLPSYNEEEDVGSSNQFYGTPRNNNNGGYNIENNVGAYSEPKKVSNSKKSSLKSNKSSQKSNNSGSHYTSPGSRPFESQTRDSNFKPVSKSSSRSRSQSQSSSGGY